MSKKFFFLFSFFFLLFSFSVFAGGCLDKSCSGTSNCNCERYRVDPGETITVYEHNLCQRVTNQSGYPQTFIPARTQTEWNLFCTYKPGHITCSNCPLPTPTPTPTRTPTPTPTRTPTPTPPPSQGSCCVAHSTPGCNNPSCQNCVCNTIGDSYCCTNQWDSTCVSEASSATCNPYCNCITPTPTPTPTPPSQGSCCVAHSTPGCNNPSCQNCVCNTIGDSYCCTNQWDSTCVSEASSATCNPYCNCVTSTPTPTPTPTPPPTPSCSASLSCQSSTENSITLSYSFSNCGAMYLYRGSTNLKNLGSGTQSGTYTDSNLSPGTSYTYYLKEGNTTKATQTCSTSAIEPKLPNCSFSGNSGIWAGMKDVAWSDSGCYICNSPNECGTCCGYCRSQLSGSYRFIYKKNWLGFRENDLRTSGGPTFVASDGWDASKTTKLCKIGNTPNISICPFSGGEKGRFYVTNEYAIQYAKIDLSNKSNWIPILYPECGSWQGFKVGGQDYHFSQCPNPDYDNCNYYVETYGCFGSDASLARCWFNWWEWPLGGSNIPSPCRICYVP